MKTLDISGKNGHMRFNIQYNLWSYFQHRPRLKHDTFVWIDYLCIDQQHSLEKNHQVQLTSDIYVKVETVIV